MKDLLCNQILNSTLIWNCRLDGYKLHSVGMGCAAVQMVWLCGHGSTVAWKNGCRYKPNPALRYSCFGLFLIFHLFVSLFDISTFPGAGKSGVSFWHWARDASGKDIFSYRDSHKKLTLAGGLRTCPSWCCCYILLSFPLPAVWGDPESRQQIQEPCVQLWDHRYPVYIGLFSFCFFFYLFILLGKCS